MAKKILIIDDNPDFLTTMKARLETNNYKVETASEGKEGLETARRVKPDVILLDLFMPEMDGYMFGEEAQKDKTIKNIPIIIVTGKDGIIDLFKVQGAKDYIVKPMDDKELLAKIEKCVGKK